MAFARVLALLGLYVLGFVAAIFTARLFKSTMLKSSRSSFILEMPPYRWPTLRSLGLRLIDRSKVFLQRAGTMILAVAMVIWVLAHLPLSDGKPPAIEHSIAGGIGHCGRAGHRPSGLQLENRNRIDYVTRCARNHGQHPRHNLRNRREQSILSGCRRLSVRI